MKWSIAENGGSGHEITIYVTSDYLAIGDDDDFVRMPMTPHTAKAIADQCQCTLPTSRMVDVIDRHAALHLAPRPLSVDRQSPATFLRHHEMIERQRRNNASRPLTTGIKKDIVTTPQLVDRPDRVAIYGWRLLRGEPIQPLSLVHVREYVDYSHGARLIYRMAIVDGTMVSVDEILQDPSRADWLSSEGVLNLDSVYKD
ncbi:MAG: hypothetical protein R3E01_03605 [Pirellulaceae bacterium]|nr:hypothetical protein [Planctomycetales bacterium]